MAMNSLILSRDANAIGLLRRVLGDNGIAIESCTGSEQFREMVAARKFDAVFVDCDDAAGASETFRQIRGVPSNRKTIGFAIVSEEDESSGAAAAGLHQRDNETLLLAFSTQQSANSPCPRDSDCESSPATASSS